ncbi:MAG: HAD hydrolase-like protein [Actinobacteria bacterium]|nr:HAD hydrolase-like protein [Actinomycetota bacterium]
MERWATFDCYGTLIDWNGGIHAELARVFGDDDAGWLLKRFHRIEPELQADGKLSYREVLTRTLERLAEEENVELPEPDRDALVSSLPAWQPFHEVSTELEESRRRRWKLAILSNSDSDLIAASQRQIGVPFDEVIVAGEIGSYKPDHGHWKEFFRRTEAPREGHVHVAASLFHDITPANELGLRSVWINRLDEHRTPDAAAPDRELPDLRGLADVLDELVAA